MGAIKDNHVRHIRSSVDHNGVIDNDGRLTRGHYTNVTVSTVARDDGPYLSEGQEDLRTDYRRLMRWRTEHYWMEIWGPKPGEPDCLIAREVIEKYGAAGG